MSWGAAADAVGAPTLADAAPSPASAAAAVVAWRTASRREIDRYRPEPVPPDAPCTGRCYQWDWCERCNPRSGKSESAARSPLCEDTEPYTCRVNISEVIGAAALAPIRAGVKVADAGLAIAAMALGTVKEALGEDGPKTVDAITDLLPVRGAIIGANRVAELTENDRALGRLLARGGPADKLTRPGGVVDLLTAPGGLLDRVSLEGSPLERIVAPGGLIDRLIAEEGPLERIFAEDGVIERVFAEEGVIDKLTVKNGPLEQLIETAEILSRLQPAVETLTPTAETLESAVDTLNRMVTTLSGIADRIPRRRSARPALRSKPTVDDGAAT